MASALSIPEEEKNGFHARVSGNKALMMKRKSHIDLLKALDSDVEEKDILGYDYLPAQTLAMNEQVENRLFKRVGRNSYDGHQQSGAFPSTAKKSVPAYNPAGDNSDSCSETDEDDQDKQSASSGPKKKDGFLCDLWKKSGRAMKTLNDHEDFELLVIVLILANCATLAMFDPMQSDESQWNSTLNKLDLSLNILFTVEMVVRIAGGNGIRGYIREPWNLFDGLMVLAGYTAFLPVGTESSEANSIRALRALRALRPLRTITRFESLRSVVVCFLEALPLLVSVVGLLFFFLFLFAIAGIQMFVSVYHKACVENGTGNLEIPMGNSPDELGCGGSRSCPSGYTCESFDEGTNIDVAGFDNIGTSMLTVFQCITLGGWSYVMYRVTDSTSMFSIIYFIFLILFEAYFVVNLFLAVLKTKFGKAQSLFRTRAQVNQTQRKNTIRKMLEWAKLQWTEFKARQLASASQLVGQLRRPSKLASVGPNVSLGQSGDQHVGGSRKRKTVLRLKRQWKRFKRGARMCHRVGHYHIRYFVLKQEFSHFFLVCIIVNTVILALEFDGMPTKMEEILQDMNTALTILFTIEMALKLLGLGFWEYISDGFNIFDSLIVVMAWVEFGFQGGSSTAALKSIKSLRVLKSFRVFRLFKMFRYLASLRKIGEVLLSSFSSFMAIVLLMFIFMVVFAIVGLHVYGGLIPNDEFPNFNSFLNSIIVMFNVLTLEDWEIIMYSVIRQSNFGSTIYFVAWVVLGKYTFLTLFLAVTLEAFESKYDVEASSEAYLAYKKAQGDTKPGGENGGDPSISPDLDPDLDMDNRLLQTIKATVSRGSSIAIAQPATMPKPEMPKWSDSDSGSVKSDDETVTEFGPDILKMLNLSRDRASSKSKNSSRNLSFHIPQENQSRSVRMNSCPLFPGPVFEGQEDEEGQMKDGPIGYEASRHFSTSAGQQVLAIANQYMMQSNSTVVGGSSPNTFWLPDLATPRVTTSSWIIPNEKEDSSSDESISSFSLYMDAALAETKQQWDKTRKQPSGMSSSSDALPHSNLEGAIPRSNISTRSQLEKDVSHKDSVVDTSNEPPEHTVRSLCRYPIGPDSNEAAIGAQTSTDFCEQDSQVPKQASSENSSPDEDGTNKRKKEPALPPLEHVSMLFFTVDNPFRIWLHKVIHTDTFDGIMFFFIICSCVAMAWEHPRVEMYSLQWRVMFYLDILFTAIFGLEFIMKSIALSFQIYIKTLTNKVDLVIVASSILVLVLESTSFNYVKGFRVLRAIKPLRALTRSAGMLLVFRSVTLSLKAMANVSIVCLLFFVIFAILGVQLFSGRFYRCNNPAVERVDDCSGLFFDSEKGDYVEAQWTNSHFNFDHLGNALLALFVTVTQDGYNDIMLNAMAVTDKGMQPVAHGNPGGFFFFMFFIMICAFCLLNLYVGVVFYQFSRIRLLSQTGSAFLTDHQQEWSELTKMVFRLKPISKAPVPKSKLKQAFYRLVNHKAFDMAVIIAIILNVMVMASTVYDEPPAFTRAKEWCNIAFFIIYAIEAVLKIYAFGWLLYIKSGWNRFDFFLVVTSAIDMIFSLMTVEFAEFLKVFGIQKLLRLLRVSRMFKLVRGLKGIKSLFTTLVISLPAFWNVGALILLLFFVYAYTGVLFFGTVKRGNHLNDHANFEKFPKAMLTLFRIATNDEWRGVMEDCMVQPPDCSKDLDNCGSLLAIPFFTTFVLLISIIMLNLFTAVIIENFEKQQDQDQWRLHPSMLDEFVDLWGEYDDGSTTIHPKSLEQLLIKLPPPLGLGHYADNNDVLKFVYDLDIPLVDGRVPFHRTIYELARRCSETLMPQGEIKNQLDRLTDKFFNSLPIDSALNFTSAVMVPRIERKWRARFQAKKLKRRNEVRQARRVVVPYSAACSKASSLLSELEKMKKAGDCPYKIAPEGYEIIRKTSIKESLSRTLHEWTHVKSFWSG